MFKSNYLKLLSFFLVFNWFIVFSRAALLPHFIKEGLTMQQIIFATMLTFWGVLLMIFLARPISQKLNAKTSWYIAIILSFIYILLLIKIVSPYQLYLAYFINGFVTFFFYVFYNAAYFEATSQKNIGKSSALMFSIGPLISLVAPFFAGSLAQVNYLYVWIFSFFFFIFPLYFVKFQKNFVIKYSIKEIYEEVRSTRFFIFIGATWEAMMYGMIPIYTLFFIKTPLAYGVYLSYLALVSIFANILLGTLTDKLQKRITFLYPITLLMSGITFLFPLATSNIAIWIIITGALQFIVPLFSNTYTAMVVDAHSNVKLAMAGREMILSVGRIVGLSLAFLSFTFERQPFYIFILLGTVMLFFPLALFWRTKVVKKYSYL